jgi:AraC-like DNA-binding protein
MDMYQADNICKFIPTHNPNEGINAIHFVYEKNADFPDKFITTATYSLNIVTAGTGVLHTLQGEYSLNRGDLFFTFQAKPFYIENTDHLHYMYITFLGLRSNTLLERLGVKITAPVYSGYEGLIDFWENALKLSSSNNIDILSESVLLYTFSYICNTFEEKKENAQAAVTILTIKKYVDDHYSDAKLSLESVSKLFSYHSKYISSQFKKTVKIGFNDYLRTIRLEHACLLMKDGFNHVTEIAHFSGYNDPLYFSKVFKQKYLISPREYIAGMNK